MISRFPDSAHFRIFPLVIPTLKFQSFIKLENYKVSNIQKSNVVKVIETKIRDL